MARRTIRVHDVVYRDGFKPGNFVVITAPDIIKGVYTGVVDNPQKFCGENTIPVYIPTDPPQRICIEAERGHTIKRATKNKS